MNVLSENIKDTAATTITATNGTNAITEAPSETSDKQIFQITQCQAEVLRYYDLDGFKNSNFNDIAGYGFRYVTDIELEVLNKQNDNQKINKLWDKALIHKYGKEATAHLKIEKKKKYKLSNLKKKNIFKL